MDKENKKTSDKKALVKKEDKAIIEEMSVEEAKNLLCRVAFMDGDPKLIMDELRKNLLPKLKVGEITKQEEEKLNKVAGKALFVYGLDTHYPLADSVNERYRPLAIEFGRQITKEFDCIAPSEKALAQTIVNAYIETIDSSRRFHNCLAAAEYLSDEMTRYLAMISKHMDRVNRQFIVALTTLKQLKAPSFEINVKTKAAFVAQNQQLNINPNKDNYDKNENIEPK